MTKATAMRDEYRMEQWASIVRQCRESGLSNREFCRLNGISEKTYYYRLRKLREAAGEIGKAKDMNASGAAECTTLCKIDLTDEPPCKTEHDRIRIQYHNAEIEVAHGTSPDTLKMVLCALKVL